MRTLYLHIGTPKTGTTALQWFFHKNRDRLKERGITYPEFGLVGDCHHRIGASFYAPERRPYFIQYENTLRLEEYCSKVLALEGDVLISTELLSHGFFAPLLRSAIGDADIRIILYLRRQDSYVLSRFNQDVKSLYGGTVEEYVERQGRYLDYRSAIIDGWTKEWGRGNMVVRTYEKEQFTNGRIFDDFTYHVFGWVVPPDFELPPRWTNPRLSPEVIEYKRTVNNLPLPDSVKCNLAGTMQGFSSTNDPSTSEAFVARVSLPLALQMTLLDRYRESNAWIAREFLGREDGQLFPELVSQSANPRQGETVLTEARAKEISLFIAEHAPDLYKPITEAVAEGLRSDDDRIRKSAVLLAGAVEAI